MISIWWIFVQVAQHNQWKFINVAEKQQNMAGKFLILFDSLTAVAAAWHPMFAHSAMKNIYLNTYILDKFCCGIHHYHIQRRKKVKKRDFVLSRQALSSLSGIFFRQKALKIEVLGAEMQKKGENRVKISCEVSIPKSILLAINVGPRLLLKTLPTWSHLIQTIADKFLNLLDSFTAVLEACHLMIANSAMQNI